MSDDLEETAFQDVAIANKFEAVDHSIDELQMKDESQDKTIRSLGRQLKIAFQEIRMLKQEREDSSLVASSSLGNPQLSKGGIDDE